MKYFLGCIFLQILVGCFDFKDIDSRDETTATTETLETTLVLLDAFNQSSSSFVSGDAFSFLIYITNNTDNQMTLTFTSSNTNNLTIQSESGDTIWDSEADNPNYEATTLSVPLQPQQSFDLVETWDQILSDGSNISVGNYTVSVEVPAVNADTGETFNLTAGFDFSIQ